jgi:hypothetical protein
MSSRVKDESRDWSAPIPVADGYDATFVIGLDNECRAFMRNGPIWQQGYRYIIRGYLCRSDRARVTGGDVEALLASITVAENTN